MGQTTQNATLDVLINDSFLKRHTRFHNLGEFETALERAGADFSVVKSHHDLNTDTVNQVIEENSGFSTFREMLHRASSEHFPAKMKKPNARLLFRGTGSPTRTG